MDLEFVKDEVAAIAAMIGDDEAAHSKEDKLYAEVLRVIAKGTTNGAELAKAALKTKKLDFARWCA